MNMRENNKLNITNSSIGAKVQKGKQKGRSKFRLIILIFIILWTTMLLFVILRQQAKNLEVNFRNASLRRQISTIRQEIRERNDKLNDAIDINQITSRAIELGLTHIKENQKRLIPQVESNRLLVHREDANAIMANGETSTLPLNRIYQNLEAYFEEHRNRTLAEAETPLVDTNSQNAEKSESEPDDSNIAEVSE